ncbi:MAG: acetyl-CoA carboxylase biotin carboxyl carrier protein subunit, partial [Bacteroidales bacterium]
NDTIATIEIEGEQYKVEFIREKQESKTKPTISKSSEEKFETVKKGLFQIQAPIPGNILEVSVQVGQVIKKGDKIAVLEAMKMENDIVSEKEGVVKSVNIKAGDVVLQGFVMIELERT